jgi:hypothetical protein
MPVVTVSLCEIGYEGYARIPKGQRSRVVNRMLKEYALSISERYWYQDEQIYGRHRRSVRDQPISAATVWERQDRMEQRLKELLEENTRLKELKE